MHWPRGKFNGQRIVGVDVRVCVDVLWWSLDWPDRFGGCLSLGPLHVWFRASYEPPQSAAGR